MSAADMICVTSEIIVTCVNILMLYSVVTQSSKLVYL